MATIRQVYLNVKDVDLSKVTIDTLVEYDDNLVAINKGQLLDGKAKDGNKIRERYKSDSYAKWKNKRNPSAGLGIPDLRNKGDFFAGFKLKIVDKSSFEIYSTDSKNDMLVKNYGKSIPFFGLNAEGRTSLIRSGFDVSLVDRFKKACKL